MRRFDRDGTDDINGLYCSYSEAQAEIERLIGVFNFIYEECDWDTQEDHRIGKACKKIIDNWEAKG